jgi:hypothetical protein
VRFGLTVLFGDWFLDNPNIQFDLSFGFVNSPNYQLIIAVWYRSV